MSKIKNEINEGLYFDDLIKKTKDFIDGTITPDEFNKWGESINLRTALPAMTKLAIMMSIMNEAMYSGAETQEVTVLEMYRNMFFYLYLQGYLGIPDITPDKITYENWDLLEPIFGSWIEGVAKRDINMFKEMLRTAIDFYGINSVTEMMNGIDYDSIEKNVKSNKELIEKLEGNKELVSDLKDIATLENPAVQKLAEVIREKAVREARESDKAKKTTKKPTSKKTVNKEITKDSKN